MLFIKMTNKRTSEIGYLKPPPPSEIIYKNLHFLIMDRPTDENIHYFLEELKSKNVKDVVRVCDPTYQTKVLQAEGIRVLDWPFDDGKAPPAQIVNDWFDLLRERFEGGNPGTSCIAVHCVAGLGRAPVLVALALIESGMKYYDAVDLIRQKRRGAINSKQLEYLERYKPRWRLKRKNNHTKQCCIV